MANTLLIIRLILSISIAFVMGKLVSKIKLPAILGWLLTGMILGPFALNFLSNDLLNAEWYYIISKIVECTVGIMLGKELLFKKLKKYGKQVLIITIFESVGTFLIVSLVFGIIFYFMNIPIYVAVIFGGIALATAPAPSLSVVNEFKTKGPLTNNLVPIAILDDIIAIVIFFSINSYIISKGKGQSGSILLTIATNILLPILIGIVLGLISAPIFKRINGKIKLLITSSIVVLLSFSVGYLFNNYVLQTPAINYMLLGMSVFATIGNIVPQEKMDAIGDASNPIVGVSLLIMIMNLAVPLDYHLVFGAGVFTAIYIISRAFGKYFSTFLGAKITKAEKKVQKYLGLTLLPHSGVSLIFTGMAVVSLSAFDTKSATIVQGTISAAAVINEILAVIISKKGFEWAGELNGTPVADENTSAKEGAIITISRQYGSGGREIANLLSKELDIPLYDKLIITETSKNTGIPKSFLTNVESNSVSPFSDVFNSAVNSVFVTSDNHVFNEQSKTIRNFAQQGSCIVVGRGGNVILNDFLKVLNVFIYAHKDKRINRIVDEYGVEQSDANKVIQMVDNNRRKYLKTYTNQDFGDVENYDLCIDSGLINSESAVKLIKTAYLDFIKVDSCN